MIILKHNAIEINKMRCIAGLVMCSTIAILNIVALLLNAANFFNDTVPEAGLGTLRMFTTLSNILVSIAAMLCIPFQIQGLRNNNYHLPNWIIDLMYIGTTTVALTFVCAISVISIAQGFVVAMFSKSNIFLHTINPILSIILFTFINCDHHIKYKKSSLTMIPIFIYALVYLIMAFIVGEEKGGWRDVYGFNAFIPWPIMFVIMMALSLGISLLLCFLHNKKHAKTKQALINYYMKSGDYDFDNIEKAINKLALENRAYYKGGYIEIPTKPISSLKQRYSSNLSDEELYLIYLKSFMNKN